MANCFLPFTFQKLLRFIQPTLLSAVLVRRRGFDSLDTSLHRAGGLLIVTQPGVRASHQIQAFRIVRAAIQKLLERVTRVAVLSGGDVSRSDLAPDFVL